MGDKFKTARDRELDFVRKLAQNEDLDWDDVFEKLVFEYDFDKEESLEYILETMSLDFGGDNPIDVLGFTKIHDIFGSETLDILKKYGFEVDVDFSDTYKVGDKVYLKLDSWCDFKDLFYKDDQYVFEKMYCNDDFYNFYDFSPSFDESWGYLDKKCIDYVKDYIKRKFLNKKVTPEDPDELEEYLDSKSEDSDEDFTITLTSEMIDRLTNDGKLDDLIKGCDEFENNLRYEIRWALESAYNHAAEREFSEKFRGEIESRFGKGEWKSKTFKNKENRPVEKYELIFNITDIFDEYVNNYIDQEGTIPSDDYTYFIEMARVTLDNNGDLLDSGINYDYYHPDVEGSDMYEELTNRL